MRSVVVATLAMATLGGCGKSSRPAPVREVRGTLSVGGKPIVVSRCRPDRGLSTYVVLETGQGALRFEDKQLYWNADDHEGILRGPRLDCTRLDRSWGGGSRSDGSAYFRGTLSFDCSLAGSPPLVVTGDLTLDCGNITAEERAQLDSQRTQLLEDQKQLREEHLGSGSGAGSGSGSAAGSGAN